MRSESVAKITLNAEKSPKFEAINMKWSSLRTIAVTYLSPRLQLTRFRACADSTAAFNTGTNNILADKSICLVLRAT